MLCRRTPCVRFALIAYLVLPAITLSAAPPAKKSAPGLNMDYGPAVCHTVTFVTPPNKDADFWEGTVLRGLTVAAGDAVFCYDADRCGLAAYWEGPPLDVSNTHYTSYKGSLPPRPGSKPVFENLSEATWLTEGKAAQMEWMGYYLHERSTVLAYTVNGRTVLERPSYAAATKQAVRTLQIGPGTAAITLIVARDKTTAEGKLHYALHAAGQPELRLTTNAREQVVLDVPASEVSRSLSISFAVNVVTESQPLADLETLTRGGALRWGEPETTRGVPAANKAAYVVDELTVPLENKYQSWMRLTGIDFFADGRLAVSTLSGDVWLASWLESDISQITWRRFATGLYEPLGLRVVNDRVYVRGRDRITRLHDLNHDGEADFYENFHTSGKIGPSYHAFLFDLVVDKEGRFYYTNSGRKAPTVGEVVRVSANGKQAEVIASRLRHPNGLGYGGPHDWLLVGDNADGKFPAGGMPVLPGATFGYEGARTVPYLYLLPPSIDTSPGSMLFTDPKRFGPLGGSLLHTSFSTSSIACVLFQPVQPFANGFAVKLPFQLRSGCMRGAVNPRDGQAYIAAQKGWDSNAVIDGLVYRVRYTGEPAYVITSASASADGIRLVFSAPLDPASVTDDNFAAERWGDKKTEVEIESVALEGEHTVLVKAAGVDPALVLDPASKKTPNGPQTYRVVDPLGITFQLRAKNGTPIKDTIWCTVNGY